MNEAFAPAIAALQEDLKVFERKARGLKEAINTLCVSAGGEPLYNIKDEDAVGTITNIRADTFYGKTIGQAAREYLDMRRGSNLGPATPREIFEALVQGGLQFETASDTNSLISVSSTLRKSSKIFHKLPNGQYGLLAWYPNAKPVKDDASDQTKSAASNEPTAENESSDASSNHQEAEASEPQTKGGQNESGDSSDLIG